MQIKKFLESTGLEQQEVDVYLALVELGSATAGQISKKSLVPRTYAYRILDQLVEKGFVESDDSPSVRRYSITDYDAPKRYLEKQQFELYSLQQEAQSIHTHLETLANPQVPTATVEAQKGQVHKEELWKLMHSTLTREVWIINPPEWWGNPDHSLEVKKWEQYRLKQHIWERRFWDPSQTIEETKYVEASHVKHDCPQATLILVDQYHLQITNWDPFRALRIESQEMVDLYKALLE